MTREEYNAIHAVNYSSIKNILRSPAHYQAAIAEKEDDPEKYAVGTLVHALLLEGKDLRSLYAIKPKGMSFASKEGKEWKANQTLPILSEDDAVKIPRMADAVAKNPDARKYLLACKERELGVVTELHGVKVKGLLDSCGEHDGRAIFSDLKTVRDASPAAFAKQAATLHYDFQLEFYSQLLAVSRGLDYPPFGAWIVVENTAPFEVQVYYPDERFMESGRRKIEKAFALYKECLEKNEWPGYGLGQKELEAPKWMEAA